jgi:sporulation protein YlmC with PRC-barrel domain
MKNIFSISKDVEKPELLKSLKSYLGRNVVSKSGESIGFIKDVLYENDSIKGFIIGKWGVKLFIEKEFISAESDKFIMLSIDPVTLYIGKKVFDGDGEYLGKVVDLIRPDTKNNITELIVRKNIFSRKILIKKNDIEVGKKNIILKVTYDEEN